MGGGGGPTFLGQVAFRARWDRTAANNDNTEWKAALNENWEQRPNENFRIRYFIDKLPKFNDVTHYFGLYYSLNGGTFLHIDDISPVINPDTVIWALESNAAGFTGGSSTTDPSLLGGTPFVYMDAAFGFDSINEGQTARGGSSTAINTWDGTTPDPVDNDERQGADFEWCLQLNEGTLRNGDEIDIRVYFDDAPFNGFDFELGDGPQFGYNEHNNTPRITVVKNTLQISGGTLTIRDGTVILR